MTSLGFVFSVVLCHAAYGFNYMDYANLYDGIVHLHRAKITGRETLQSANGNWKAWEFLGVRYAKAERFQPPKFYDDFEMEESPRQNAHVEAGPACMSRKAQISGNSSISERFSEDCLFMNIHLPLINQDHGQLRTNLWPVMVVVGTDDDMAGWNLDVNEFSWDNNVIVITISFRSGLFSYLSTDDWNAKGNWGLKDIKMALTWIQQYISRFGANPDRIVLCGVGSGGGLIPLLMLDEQVREVISGVITIHAQPLQQPVVSGYHLAAKLAATAGCADVNSSRTITDCLISKSVTEILQAEEIMRLESNFTWLPVADGDLIPFFRADAYFDWVYNGSVLISLDLNDSIGAASALRSQTELTSNLSSCETLKMSVSEDIAEFQGCVPSETFLDKVEKYALNGSTCGLVKPGALVEQWHHIFQRALPLMFPLDLISKDRIGKGHGVHLVDMSSNYTSRKSNKLLGAFVAQRFMTGSTLNLEFPKILKLDSRSDLWAVANDENLNAFLRLWVTDFESACVN